MRIGELARATGVDVDTIRFYEKAQLLAAPTRTSNGYRTYTHAHLERLAFIRHCRALDIPLAEVQRLLVFLDNPQADCAEINLLIDAQLAAQCKTPRNRASSGPRHSISHDFIPGIGFPFPF